MSLTEIRSLKIEWEQETRNKSIAEITEFAEIAAKEANQSREEPEIVVVKDENKMITASETLKKLDNSKIL